MKQRLASLVLLVSLLPVSARAGNGFKALVPVYVSSTLPGANGSLWQSELVMYNNSNVSYEIQTCPRDCTPLLDDEELNPGETQRGLPQRVTQEGTPGVVLEFLPGGSRGAPPTGTVALQLRVRDLSRNASSAGAEIPVVPESEFRSRPIQLLDVPNTGGFRFLLRIYEMNLESAPFNLRVYDALGGTLLREGTVVAAPSGGYPVHPAYVQSNALFDGLPSTSPRIRVEIAPGAGASRFWAFITVTNNSTQELTVISPQDLDVLSSR